MCILFGLSQYHRYNIILGYYAMRTAYFNGLRVTSVMGSSCAVSTREKNVKMHLFVMRQVRCQSARFLRHLMVAFRGP